MQRPLNPISNLRRWTLRIAITTAVVGLVLSAAAANWAPALAALACPRCYGLEHAAARIYVDAEMPAEQRRALVSSIASAESVVSAFYGKLERRPYILACGQEACDRRLGGRGARATTHSTWRLSVLVLSPRGQDRTIVAHELSHVQVHATIGVLNQMRGTLPAWFDEGLAVIVSEDDRYVRAGKSAADRCLQTTRIELPSSPFVWGPQSGKTPWIYANAACAVLQWMEANGGKTGLIDAVRELANGRRALP